MGPPQGKKRAGVKRKVADDGNADSRLSSQDSENTKLRKSILEVKSKCSDKKKVLKPDSYAGSNCEVHENYACMLNQTNIGQNNNKYYVIQILKEAAQYMCFTRWGRVGEGGQNSKDMFLDADHAIAAFKKKFKDKTKNDWDRRDNFCPVSGKYTLLEMEILAMG